MNILSVELDKAFNLQNVSKIAEGFIERIISKIFTNSFVSTIVSYISNEPIN